MVMGGDEIGGVLMRKYEIGRLLGQGAFAKVYYAKNVETSQSVAVKIIDKEKVLKVGLLDQIKREISVMKMVSHPNVVHLYEVMASKSKIYFVLEYARGGELFRRVAKGRLKEEAARKIFQQLILTVGFCHGRGVYHRDLKPENLLLDENGNLKISDFGLSALADSRRQDGLLHTACGTPAYVAPEVISRRGYDGAKSDIWSCGVILYVLMAGFLPFRDPNLMEMYKKITKADVKCPDWFSIHVQKLLMRMLDPNPSTRISIAKIMESSWIRRGMPRKHTEINIQVKESESIHEEAVITSSSSSCEDEEGKAIIGRVTSLNAFDIISLSSGFDLSGLFESDRRTEARFTSNKPAALIISQMEGIAKCLNLQVKRKAGGILSMESACREGSLAIDAEIFEVAHGLHLVDIKKGSGDASEFERMLMNDIKPALAEII